MRLRFRDSLTCPLTSELAELFFKEKMELTKDVCVCAISVSRQRQKEQ